MIRGNHSGSGCAVSVSLADALSDRGFDVAVGKRTREGNEILVSMTVSEASLFARFLRETGRDAA